MKTILKKVLLEYFTLNICSDNLVKNISKNNNSKKEKTKNHSSITLNYNIEQLIVEWSRYKSLLEISLPSIKYPFSQNDLYQYWKNINVDKEINNINENILEMELGIDYVIAPVYVVDNIVILGIIILGKNIISNEFKKISCRVYLSTVNINLKNSQSISQKSFNVLNGILNYTTLKCGVMYNHCKNISNEYLEIDIYEKDKIIGKDVNVGEDIMGIKRITIRMDYVFRNLQNYIPKIEVIIKPKEVIKIFQSRLNP